MRVTTLFLSAVNAAGLVSANLRTANIYIQPISSTASPSHLAEVSYDTASLTSSSIISYDAPDIPETSDLVRIGLYDPKSSRWLAGTTVASADNFSKGYSPTIMLTVDAKGELLSAACKGVQIDAGQTRDFGPKAVIILETKGKQPELNKPVVLSPEGRQVVEEEKTFLQKYWWVIGIVVFMALSGGAGGDK